MQAAVSKSIMFGLYNWYDQNLTDLFGGKIGSIPTSHVAALMSGSSEAVLTPFEACMHDDDDDNNNNYILHSTGTQSS
jgi:hypothetical protein